MKLPDVFLLKSKGFADTRGLFFESFEQATLSEALGRPFSAVQSNFSVSRRGTLRGIHGARGSAGQAKVVSCVRGSVIDIIVDLRVGSPTFGTYELLWLDSRSLTSVYIGEGLGHSFLALTDDTCMHYCCSTSYVADDVFSVNALDKTLALPWGLTEKPVMSDNDLAAPPLDQALAEGLLPTYEECLAIHRKAS
ncbi:dTDP-4-dehydrorhamnose 3,5-epimerase family protein [Streptomyces inhibens]|uniref:dTDP-4-dehydrorhamnose 3,5-epimerase family protein n=1 Tax=Streptomyces inhibens TaxID=2293571 RepID=UPI001EE6D8EC|nr:dTDP-4-dehydrorhamnose 3,5-epimerase family protein [Streptomyces inhibens]UKY51792.1 dTDP-4-dehydrorhamnose 3,5-epimerase family protein [Streptomyces inhibens]